MYGLISRSYFKQMIWWILLWETNHPTLNSGLNQTHHLHNGKNVICLKVLVELLDLQVGNQKQPGAINESGQFYAIWKAGDQKPNFQTSTGKIRVMVTYDHEDPNNPGSTIQGSGWDGYEAENGPTFTLNAGDPMLPYSNSEFRMFFKKLIPTTFSVQVATK